MLILTIRTDKPEAEIGLFEDQTRLAYETWQAHRELSDTIHLKIQEQLTAQHKALKDIKGIVCFRGPGSFTGLRIGLTVANALAYACEVPLIATQGSGWIAKGIQQLAAGENQRVALPRYGSPVHITLPKR